MSPSHTGTLRVNRDIVVQHAAQGELQVLSREPAVRDEQMSLHFPDVEPYDAVHVRVIDSRPVMIRGAVRHLLRLHVIGAGPMNSAGQVSSSQEGGS